MDGNLGSGRADYEPLAFADAATALQPSFAPEPPPAEVIELGDGRIPFGVRLFEIAVASAALILFSPLILLQAIWIRLGTAGRVFFVQQRIGINQKLFPFLKFRTLYADARQRFPELYAYRYSDEELLRLHFKVDNDPRVTPQGKWLRRLSIDELPNFWNVLTGDMALVGPRPEIPEMLPYYRGDMKLKFCVRPGITGLAQISGRGRLTFYDTVRYDVEYVRRRSFLLDLKILAKTIWMIVIRDGAF